MKSVQHRSDNGGRLFSGGIWADCPVLDILSGVVPGFVVGSDFENAPILTSATSAGGLITYQDTSATAGPVDEAVTAANGFPVGVMSLATPATNNKQVSLTTGSGVAGLAQVLKGGKELWFETRIRAKSVLAEAVMVALIEKGQALVNVQVDTTGQPAAKNYIGFRSVSATPTLLDAVFCVNAGTEVVLAAGVATLVNSVWVKLGLRFNTAENQLIYYINGVPVATVSDVTLATFPSGVNLAVLWALKALEAVAKTLQIDGWRMAGLT